MTDHRSPLDTHVDAFRDGLTAGAARLRLIHRRRRRATAIGVPLVAVASLALAFWPGERASVLDRAEAALSPSTGVVHLRVSSEPIGMKKPPCLEDPADMWLEAGPHAPRFPRWRVRQNSSKCLTRGVSFGLGHIATGRQDEWFNGHDRSTYALDDGWVETLTDVTSWTRAFPDPTGLGSRANGASVDPITALRHLLATGKVHEAGRSTVDGRPVQLLRGQMEMALDAKGRPINGELTVAVDADSFVPVEITRKLPRSPRLAQRPANASIGDRVRFLAYDTATEQDLQPVIPAGTVTATADYRAFRHEVLRAHAYPPKPIPAAERARAKARFAELHGGPPS